MPAGYAAAAIGMRGDAEVQKRVGKVLGNCIERILRNEGEMKGDPAKRAFYRAFRDLNPLNDLGSGSKPRSRLFPGCR